MFNNFPAHLLYKTSTITTQVLLVSIFIKNAKFQFNESASSALSLETILLKLLSLNWNYREIEFMQFNTSTDRYIYMKLQISNSLPPPIL